ncbi:MAG: YebC/PmpR family DNA-binding transcriptional regulator [Firmicutes bacterium]|nr:YebC/PmpR family DNA-binding transcriptional regulator [Bacillota bacterium]
MSGHSKWNNIKRTKEKSDAQKGKIFTKIGREIAVAVKIGGADPVTNPRLQALVAKAKQANMPNDTITRSIKKASGELGNVNYEEVLYEGYGVGGSAVIVKCLTDNKNRTAGDVRHTFDKFGGSLGTIGCVSFMFDNKGIIILEKDNKLTEDDIFMAAVEAGADDVCENEDSWEISCAPNMLDNVQKALKDIGGNVLSAETEMVAQNYVDLDEKQLETFTRMTDMFEDNDDIQEIYHNVNM